MIPKFRAWLKNHKKMAEVLEIDFEGEQIIYSYFDSYGAFGVELKHVELLQFTGLYDKNKTPEHPQGVPIYEGHILQIPYTYYDHIDFGVKVPYDEYILGIVAFNKEKACFGVVIPEDVDELSKGFNSFELVFDILGIECAVVGDKFNDKELADGIENPELLEG